MLISFHNKRMATIVLCVAAALLGAATYFGLTMAQQAPFPPVVSIKDAYIECIELQGDETIAECLDELAASAYGNYPTSEIAAVLDTLTYTQKNRWCHEVMHYMGWKAYAAEEDIAKAFLNSSELCDSGMYHGVMEEFLRREGLSADVGQLIKNVCTTSLSSHPQLSEGSLALCYHGLGHGLMYITSSDLQASLDYCDMLDAEHAGICYGGVFMEHSASKAIGPLSNSRDLTDSSYCEALSEKHKDTCYFRQGLDNFSATNGSVREGMRLCLSLDPSWQQRCFEGVGSNNPSPGKSHATAGTASVFAL